MVGCVASSEAAVRGASNSKRTNQGSIHYKLRFSTFYSDIRVWIAICCFRHSFFVSFVLVIGVDFVAIFAVHSRIVTYYAALICTVAVDDLVSSA